MKLFCKFGVHHWSKWKVQEVIVHVPAMLCNEPTSFIDTQQTRRCTSCGLHTIRRVS